MSDDPTSTFYVGFISLIIFIFHGRNKFISIKKNEKLLVLLIVVLLYVTNFL